MLSYSDRQPLNGSIEYRQPQREDRYFEKELRKILLTRRSDNEKFVSVIQCASNDVFESSPVRTNFVHQWKKNAMKFLSR